MSNTIHIVEEICAQLDIAEVYSELAPEEHERYYIVKCPSCNQRKAYISKTKKYLVCNRKNKCNYFITLWEYVKQTYNCSNNQETLFLLAEMANYNISKHNTPGVENELYSYQTKVSIMEKALFYFQQQLQGQSDDTVIKQYIKKRGYTSYFQEMELGYFPGFTPTINYLTSQGYTQESIKKYFPFIEVRNQYQLVFPYRTPGGSIKSIWGRTLCSNSEKKYLPFSKSDKSTLFNIHNVKKDNHIIVVEGYLDALVATAKKISGVVALGGADISEKQLQSAIKLGIKSYTLALDNDEAGQEGTKRAITKILREECAPYVAEIPKEYKDPDEMIQSEGIAPFNHMVEQAVSGAKWLMINMVKKYSLNSDKAQRDFLQEAVTLEATLSNPLDRQNVIQSVVAKLNIPHEEAEQYFQSFRFRELQFGYKKLLDGAQKKLSSGKIHELDEYLRTHLKKLRKNHHTKNKEPHKSFAASLETQFQQEREMQGKFLGFELSSFETIAEKIDGIQAGFYIIAADTNIGKTAFLTNLFLDIIFSNKKSQGIYFSLDDSYKVITTRFRSIMTQIPINQIKKRSLPQQEKKINAEKQLLELAKKERVLVKDLSDIQCMEELESCISKQNHNNLFVCVDGLHNLQVTKKGGLREENIERANRLKTLVDKYNIPLITTAELRKRSKNEAKTPPSIHDLMESSKFAYNANLVWILYPNKSQDTSSEKITLILDYQKNKLSSFKSTQQITFFRNQGRFEMLAAEN